MVPMGKDHLQPDKDQDTAQGMRAVVELNGGAERTVLYNQYYITSPSNTGFVCTKGLCAGSSGGHDVGVCLHEQLNS
jgi:hypothetical protein